jgi:hypothetical protein
MHYSYQQVHIHDFIFHMVIIIGPIHKSSVMHAYQQVHHDLILHMVTIISVRIKRQLCKR